MIPDGIRRKPDFDISFGITILRILLGLVFLLSSAFKIYSLSSFESSLRQFQLLPDFLIPISAYVIPSIEFSVGICLIISRCVQLSLNIILTLMALFTIVLVTKITEGAQIGCGCFGPLDDGTISGWTITRNILLIFVTLILAIWYDGKRAHLFNKESSIRNVVQKPIIYSKVKSLLIMVGSGLLVILSLQNMVLKERLLILTADYKVLQSGDVLNQLDFIDSSNNRVSIPFDNDSIGIVFLMKIDCNPCKESIEIWNELINHVKYKNIRCIGILTDSGIQHKTSIAEIYPEVQIVRPLSNAFKAIFKSYITPQTIMFRKGVVIDNWTGKFTREKMDILLSKINGNESLSG